MLKTLVVTVVGGLVVWFVQNHFRDIPTATYSASDAIEIVGSQGKAEFAQEVAITNSGQSTVKGLSIKVPRHVSTHKLTRHSNQAKEEVFSEPSSFELVYPELPSGQRIKLLVRYDGAPLERDWISISHANGHAVPQESQRSPINYLWLWIAFTLGIVSQSLGDFRRWRRESFGKWADADELFRNDKPWYASASEWSEMQSKAIERTLAAYDYLPIEQVAYYQLLNRSKPTLLSEDHWAKLQQDAASLLMARFSREITRYSNIDKLVDHFKLKKPEGLSNQLWNDFQDSLKTHIQARLLPPHLKASGFVSLLEANNATLSALPIPIANEIRDLAQRSYADYLNDGSCFEIRNDPATVLATARFDLLTSEQSASVKENLLRFSRLKAMPSIWNIRALESFIAKGRPEWMSEEEFNSIGSLVTQANALSSERDSLRSAQLDIGNAKRELDSLKKRVRAQLDLIDKVLADPGSIDKIEDYDPTFAPGNRKNLERVASLLKSGKC